MRKTIIIIIAVVLVAAAGYFLWTSRDAEVTETPTPVANKTFSDTDLGFSFDYPENMELLKEAANVVRVYKLGPTQTDNTELFDGMSVSFIKLPMSEETLKEVVDFEVAQLLDAGGEITSDPEEIKINDLDGYTFTFIGLGEFTAIFLPFDEESYVGISYILADPGDLGFQKTVENIVDSFKLLE